MMNDWDYPSLGDIHSASARKYEKLEYTYIWLIENYSYCLQKNGKALESPWFLVNGLEDISWHLQLYPRGCVNKRLGSISIFLKRSEAEIGPEKIPVKFELSLLAADGSAVKSEELHYEFKMGERYGSVCLLHINDLFLRHKDALLPQDTLSVRCKMWVYNSAIHKVGQAVARTRIRVEHLYFLKVVEGFSALKPKEKKKFFLKSSRGLGFVKARLQLSDSSDGTISLKITPRSDKKVLSTCNLFLVGAFEKLTKCVEGDNRADALRKDISKLTLSLTKNEILERRGEFLPDGKLTVLCQCSFSTGVKYEKIEETVYDIPSSLLNQINYDPVAERLSTYSSAIDLINNFKVLG